MSKPQILQRCRAAIWATTWTIAGAAALSGLVGCGVMGGDRSDDSDTTSSTQRDTSRRADAGTDSSTGTSRSSTGTTSTPGTTRDCADRSTGTPPDPNCEPGEGAGGAAGRQSTTPSTGEPR